MIEKFYAKSVSVAQATDKIREVAERLGIVLPSTHTALFQSVYAPIHEANLNGVRLARKAVEESLQKMVGSQVNLEHMGYGWIVGIILDAWINANDEIEIVYSFAKNIYKDEYVQALEALNNEDLSVSFELLSETASQESLDDGTVLLHDIDFQGVGMLITNPPAYPKAKTYSYATTIKNRLAEKENRELVFAKKIEQTCDKILADIYSDNPDQPMLPENIYLISTTDNGHFHVANIDWDGNGSTISTMGTDVVPHVHKIVNWQFQETNNHAHRIMNEIMAKIKENVKMELGAKWTRKYINTLPNSSFAVIEPAYLKGDTDNKNARHLPYKDANGKIDLPHYRNALARANQIIPVTDSISTEELRNKALKELNKHKDVLKTAETTQGGNKIVEFTEEQKAKIAEVRTELGDAVKDLQDKDLLDETVVAEIRKEVEKAKAEAQEQEKSELEKAQEEITTLKAKVEELTTTLEATKSEVETVRQNAEKIGELKVQLKDNEFAKDFTDEDYLDAEKVEKAIQDKKNAEVVATRKEELKDNEYAKDFSDDDYLNDTKVELAQVKKQADELKAKLPKEKKEASANEDPMNTGDEDPDPEVAKREKYQATIKEIRKASTQK